VQHIPVLAHELDERGPGRESFPRRAAAAEENTGGGEVSERTRLQEISGGGYTDELVYRI